MQTERDYKKWLGTQLNSDGSYSDRYDVPSNSNTDESSVASHSCTDGNAIEQDSENALHHIINEAAEYMGMVVHRLKKKDPNYPYLTNVRESAFKLNRVVDVLRLESKPNWYVLYEGLCGSHIQQRENLRQMRVENQILRRELKEWKLKYNDAINRLNSDK